MAETRSPPFEAVMLVASHLEPTSLAISSCVCRSWRSALSADELWLPICVALSPSLSTYNPFPSYHRLFSLLHAARRRASLPPPSLSLDNIFFSVDLVNTRGREPVFSKVEPGSALTKSCVFRFDFGGGDVAAPAVNEMRSLWTVVGRGWKEAVVMMEGRGKAVAVREDEVYFLEEIPAVGGGEMVAEMVVRLGFGRRVVGLTVGVIRVGEWRYVQLDDGLRYLQHFLSPH